MELVVVVVSPAASMAGFDEVLLKLRMEEILREALETDLYLVG